MKMLEQELVVLDIAGGTARLATEDALLQERLLSIGFAREGDQFLRQIVDDMERQQVVRELIEMDALFSAGRDWSPAELVEYYREQGAISGSYRKISWRDPEHYTIVEC